MAAPLLSEPTEIFVGVPVESKPYIDLTISALETFGVEVARENVTRDKDRYWRLAVSPTRLKAPAETLKVPGDWSNAAFWLAAGALSAPGITVSGLDLASAQGDRQVLGALAAFGARVGRGGGQAGAMREALRPQTIDVTSIPDLMMPLAAVACYAKGVTTFTGAARLRLKESDRLLTCSRVITALGGTASFTDDALTIEGTGRLTGGTVWAAGDHRIAMMAAIAASYAEGETEIFGAECVEKSYPGFWEDFATLGGDVTTLD